MPSHAVGLVARAASVCTVVTNAHETVEAMAPNGRHMIGLKVFSATKAREREFLGETITDWIRRHPDYELFAKVVTQSSDREFHCIAITILFWYQS